MQAHILPPLRLPTTSSHSQFSKRMYCQCLRQFHSTTFRCDSQPPSPPPPPSSLSQSPHQPHQQRPPRRAYTRFSLPTFLFFAFTFAAITTSMDTTPSPGRKSSTSTPFPSASRTSNDLDASPTSPFVDDNGNAIGPASEDNDDDYYGESGNSEGGKGIRDVEKERQHDTFNRYGRQRRIPWTLKEVAQAEKWQRESRGSALGVEREGEEGRRA